jgi:hypothetical protein
VWIFSYIYSADIQVNNTALHEACGVPVLQRLIQAGADLNATNEVIHRSFITLFA